MSNFKKWNDRYKKHWRIKLQLRELSGLDVLTADEYEIITGEEYDA